MIFLSIFLTWLAVCSALSSKALIRKFVFEIQVVDSSVKLEACYGNFLSGLASLDEEVGEYTLGVLKVLIADALVFLPNFSNLSGLFSSAKTLAEVKAIAEKHVTLHAQTNFPCLETKSLYYEIFLLDHYDIPGLREEFVVKDSSYAEWKSLALSIFPLDSLMNLDFNRSFTDHLSAIITMYLSKLSRVPERYRKNLCFALSALIYGKLFNAEVTCAVKQYITDTKCSSKVFIELMADLPSTCDGTEANPSLFSFLEKDFMSNSTLLLDIWFYLQKPTKSLDLVNMGKNVNVVFQSTIGNVFKRKGDLFYIKLLNGKSICVDVAFIEFVDDCWKKKSISHSRISSFLSLFHVTCHSFGNILLVESCKEMEAVSFKLIGSIATTWFHKFFTLIGLNEHSLVHRITALKATKIVPQIFFLPAPFPNCSCAPWKLQTLKTRLSIEPGWEHSDFMIALSESEDVIPFAEIAEFAFMNGVNAAFYEEYVFPFIKSVHFPNIIKFITELIGISKEMMKILEKFLKGEAVVERMKAFLENVIALNVDKMLIALKRSEASLKTATGFIDALFGVQMTISYLKSFKLLVEKESKNLKQLNGLLNSHLSSISVSLKGLENSLKMTRVDKVMEYVQSLVIKDSKKDLSITLHNEIPQILIPPLKPLGILIDSTNYSNCATLESKLNLTRTISYAMLKSLHASNDKNLIYLSRSFMVMSVYLKYFSSKLQLYMLKCFVAQNIKFILADNLFKAAKGYLKLIYLKQLEHLFNQILLKQRVSMATLASFATTGPFIFSADSTERALVTIVNNLMLIFNEISEFTVEEENERGIFSIAQSLSLALLDERKFNNIEKIIVACTGSHQFIPVTPGETSRPALSFSPLKISADYMGTLSQFCSFQSMELYEMFYMDVMEGSIEMTVQQAKSFCRLFMFKNDKSVIVLNGDLRNALQALSKRSMKPVESSHILSISGSVMKRNGLVMNFDFIMDDGSDVYEANPFYVDSLISIMEHLGLSLQSVIRVSTLVVKEEPLKKNDLTFEPLKYFENKKSAFEQKLQATLTSDKVRLLLEKISALYFELESFYLSSIDSSIDQVYVVINLIEYLECKKLLLNFFRSRNFNFFLSFVGQFMKTLKRKIATVSQGFIKKDIENSIKFYDMIKNIDADVCHLVDNILFGTEFLDLNSHPNKAEIEKLIADIKGDFGAPLKHHFQKITWYPAVSITVDQLVLKDPSYWAPAIAPEDNSESLVLEKITKQMSLSFIVNLIPNAIASIDNFIKTHPTNNELQQVHKNCIALQNASPASALIFYEHIKLISNSLLTIIRMPQFSFFEFNDRYSLICETTDAKTMNRIFAFAHLQLQHCESCDLLHLALDLFQDFRYVQRATLKLIPDVSIEKEKLRTDRLIEEEIMPLLKSTPKKHLIKKARISIDHDESAPLTHQQLFELLKKKKGTIGWQALSGIGYLVFTRGKDKFILRTTNPHLPLDAPTRNLLKEFLNADK